MFLSLLAAIFQMKMRVKAKEQSSRLPSIIFPGFFPLENVPPENFLVGMFKL
jgi:hypothetical protein